MALSTEEFEIECITQQKGNLFEVKWVGYDYTQNTWETRETVQEWKGFYKFICQKAKEENKPIPTKPVTATGARLKNSTQVTKIELFNF